MLQAPRAPAARWAAAPAVACPRSRARARAQTRSAAPRRRATAGSPRRARRSAAPAAAAGTSPPPCPRPARVSHDMWTSLERPLAALVRVFGVCHMPRSSFTQETTFLTGRSLGHVCQISSTRTEALAGAPAPRACYVLAGRSRPRACQSGCWWLAGRRGMEAGVQCAARITRSASRKFRNRLATSRSCARARPARRPAAARARASALVSARRRAFAAEQALPSRRCQRRGKRPGAARPGEPGCARVEQLRA